MDSYRTLPGFAMTIVIVDLVMCILRLLCVALGVLVLASGVDVGAIRQTAAFEIVSGIGVALFGILGNILILTKRPLGVSLGWLSLGFFCLSLFTGVWQAWIKIDSHRNAERIGFLFGAVVVTVFRLGLGGLYAAALVQARNSLEPLVAEVVERPSLGGSVRALGR